MQDSAGAPQWWPVYEATLAVLWLPNESTINDQYNQQKVQNSATILTDNADTANLLMEHDTLIVFAGNRYGVIGKENVANMNQVWAVSVEQLLTTEPLIDNPGSGVLLGGIATVGP